MSKSDLRERLIYIGVESSAGADTLAALAEQYGLRTLNATEAIAYRFEPADSRYTMYRHNSNIAGREETEQCDNCYKSWAAHLGCYCYHDVMSKQRFSTFTAPSVYHICTVCTQSWGVHNDQFCSRLDFLAYSNGKRP